MTNIFDLLARRQRPLPLVGGHRGHASPVRENTLKNFAQVKAQGVPYIEIDVQLSRDGQAVIFHDRELSEKTPLRGGVGEYTVAELKAAFELCTLGEALSWCRENQMPLLLEMKCWGGEGQKALLARRMAEEIAANGAADLCVPLCADGAVLRRIKEALPSLSVAVIGDRSCKDPLALMKQTGASIYLAYLEDLDRALVETLHRAGYVVDGSVVNDRQRLGAALDLQVDLIESDDPAAIRAMLDE